MGKKIILVTGSSRVVGKAIQKVVKEEDPIDEEWIFISSKDADLIDTQETKDVFAKYKPTHVIHLAAEYGALFGKVDQHIETMRKNLRINDNVFEAARLHNCQKIVSCLSSNIFPDTTHYPVDESMIYNGQPHKATTGYAYAKRLIDVANHNYNEAFGVQYTSVILTNIYGPSDNFNLNDCHVLPGLVHKCFLAQRDNKPFVIYGTGAPMRQFMFSEDLARLMLWTLREYSEIDPIILSVPEEDEISIKELALIIAEAFNFKGDIVFDKSKSDGQIKKTTDNTKLKTYLPEYKFKPIKEGVTETINWFKAKYPDVRL